MRDNSALVGLALGFTAISLGGCGIGDKTGPKVEQIFNRLAIQDYGFASSYYRMHEAELLSEDAAPAWRRGLEHEDPTVRQWTVDALSRIGISSDVGCIEAALDDRFRKVRDAAAEGLIRTDPKRAQTAFMARLDGTDPVRVSGAAQGLGALGSAESVAPILGRLADLRLPSGARTVLVQVLGTIGSVEAAEPLAMLALDSETDAKLRQQAAESLVALDLDAVSGWLQRVLESSDDEYVQGVIEGALEVGKVRIRR